MQSPTTSAYSGAAVDYPSTPRRRGTSKIDYSKYKTKMCRNYLLGVPCPFEERCAFSHGPRADEAHSTRTAAAAATTTSKQQRRHARHGAPRYEGVSVASSDTAAAATDASSDSNSETYAAVLPPPPYEVAVQDEYAMLPDEYAPPAYPTRYRYDPYSPTGVLYEA